MVHASYTDFVEAVVLPRRAKNPTDRRFDGALAGGNWSVAGVFQHHGREWKVHEDSHYEPLLAAYETFHHGIPSPFVEEPTKTLSSLNLRTELRAKLSERKHKYIYIYST